MGNKIIKLVKTPLGLLAAIVVLFLLYCWWYSRATRLVTPIAATITPIIPTVFTAQTEEET